MKSNIKKNKLWINLVTLIGMIMYVLFVPLPLKASEISQSDVAKNSQFDMTLLYWAIGIVGGCIAITLLYVGYKKYKGEQQKKKQEKSYDEKEG